MGGLIEIVPGDWYRALPPCFRESSHTARGRPGHECPAVASSGGLPAQLQPELAPQVSHLQQAPLRTRVKWLQVGHGSPS